MSKKIGFDIHGLINKNPELFRDMIRDFKDLGFEIHILTGSTIDKGILDELTGYDIGYDHLFSITDYHRNKNTYMWENENGWWLDDEVWDETKSVYCRENEIDLCIDDTKVYNDYFTTPFGFMTSYSEVPRTLELYSDADSDIMDIIKKYSGTYYNIKFIK